MEKEDEQKDECYPFDKNIHILTYAPNNEQSLKILELRKLLENDCDIYNKHTDIKEWCDDLCLLRFLIARNFDLIKSFEMIHGAIKWRIERKPHHIEVDKDDNWKEKMLNENKTGKIYVAGQDKWGRPIVIFDNSVQNTTDTEGQLYFLAWNLETAIKFMPKNKTDKYVIFMHLENFSLFNCPNMKATKETIFMLCQSFPERLGHCVCYMSPSVFFYVYETVKFLIDKRTRDKIIFLTGDMTDGSVNDKKMKTVLGDDWKEITGAGQPIITKGSSPGFNFEKYWDNHMKKIESLSSNKNETWRDSHHQDSHLQDSRRDLDSDLNQFHSKNNNKSDLLLYIILATGLFFVVYSLKVTNKKVSIVCGLLGIIFFYGALILYPNSIDLLIAYDKNDKNKKDK